MADKKKSWLSFLGVDLEKTKKQKNAEDISIQDNLEREAYKEYAQTRSLHGEDYMDFETFRKKRTEDRKKK